MKYITLTALLLSLIGCSSTPLEKKRRDTIDCVKELIGNDTESLDAFQICREVYDVKLIKDKNVQQEKPKSDGWETK